MGFGVWSDLRTDIHYAMDQAGSCSASSGGYSILIVREVLTMNTHYSLASAGLRDPEGRTVNEQDPFEIREKMLDKTIADSFPASDPPSTDPAPGADSFAW